ncbi:very-long-chain 3-oxoacyl-CoA reductase [Hippoglossus hippoglossus]|uniref:very-long-chain 3-oxoacyl-CoA reductase n=1 Tax=Hippoglossus hippoglossus TaxID=8267 RepID=UPI00148B807D|nr:very-long-chain 3-oxoacyl-CoA reductase [Hippoglossus hippoglossus]
MSVSISEVLTIIGGLTVVFHLLRLTWKCWCGFREFVLAEVWHMDLRTYGQWAVVTGATSGIGKAYACELACRGLDIVLVSRSDDKLRIVAKEIEHQYGRKTRTIRADFTDGHSIYPAIAEGLQGLEIGILVNNVGMSYSDKFAVFLDVQDPERKITEVINCNVLSVPQMTRMVLPDMIKRGKGLIINISSEIGVRPQPFMSLYSATKIFVTYFSQCLNTEYKGKGITVQCVAPFFVSTNMTHNIKPNCFVKSASGFAHEALNTVGHSSYTSGCLSHALQNVALTVLLPDWLRMSQFLARKLQRWSESVERRASEEEEKLREKEE